VLVGWDIAELAVQAAGVVPVDPLHSGVFDVVDGAQRAVRNGLLGPTASVLNSPIVVSAKALS
jgi:hypothetical protein